MDTDNESEIQLSGDRFVDVHFKAINLTGIPDEDCSPLDDLWDDDLPMAPCANGTAAPTSIPTAPLAPKSV